MAEGASQGHSIVGKEEGSSERQSHAEEVLSHTFTTDPELRVVMNSGVGIHMPEKKLLYCSKMKIPRLL